MRVIAGKYRGRPLQAPSGKGVRPTGDRVREALFSVLYEHLPDARVLDLFAGAGSLGIEAISRGASSALFVEPNRTHTKVLQKNLEFVDEPTAVWPTSSAQAIRRIAKEGRCFDLIFLDPPYDTTLLDESLASIAATPMLSQHGCIVCEYRSSSARDSWASDWNELFSRQYGEATLAILEASTKEGPAPL